MKSDLPVAVVASNAAPVDPLELLPNELFILIFSNLRQLDICAASSTNSKWRSILLSSPQLYSTLHLLLQGGSLDRPSQVQAVKANSQIQSLIKASQLSQNRIKSLHLDAGCLILGQFETMWSNWEASRFSTLIDVLSLSREHLKRVEIDLPELNLEDDSVILPQSCQMVCNILYGLRIFDNLKTIKLTASTLITLRNQSENKLLILQDNYEPEAGEVETSTGHEMILGGISGLLGDHLTDIRLSGGLDLTVVRLLEKSKTTLERIDLSGGEIEGCEREIIEFITDCPNLVTLGVRFPNLSPSDQTRPRFSIPPTFNHVSNLKSINISGEVALPWKDQSLYTWLGKKLTYLSVGFSFNHNQERLLSQSQIDGQLFNSFLRPLSSTLTSLYLENLFLEAIGSGKETQNVLSEGKLEMEGLKRMEVSGNMELINFILNIKCPNLGDVNLTPFELDGHELQELDYESLKEFLKNSSATLVDLQIEPQHVKMGKSPSKPRIFSGTSSSSHEYLEKSPVVFQKLEALELEMDGVQIVECFAFHHYPKLKLVFLNSNDELEPMFEKWTEKNRRNGPKK